MSVESEGSEANAPINYDLREIQLLDFWAEYDVHICMYCKEALGHLEQGKPVLSCGRPIYKMKEMLRSGAYSACLRLMVTMGCLEWAALRLERWEEIEYIYNNRSYGVYGVNDWKDILLLKSAHYKNKTLQVKIDNSSCDSLSRSTGSLKTLNQIKKWLEECMKCGYEHNMCRFTKENDIDHNAQVRFLDIRNDAIRLIDASITTTHACLSHCWGPPNMMIKTTKHNVEEHRHGIILDRLPKTFQDAMQVCRHVGIDYIWIDSLCIIQDDDDDWKIQASLMAAIYEGAILTIAASKASSPHDGLFTTRSDAYLGDILPGLPGVLIREKPPRYPDFEREMTFNLFVKGEWPLYDRGWCFQELELSPRIIHFGPHECLWECWSFRYRESYPGHRYVCTRRAYPEGNADVHANLWHDCIREYSRRSLTYPEDRLPAIAAIAKKLQNLNPERRYIAGLWTDTLLYDLLWIKRNLEAKSYTPHELQTPSWSWASLTGGVSWVVSVDSTSKTLAKVVRTDYTTDGPEIIGHIREASITLLAPIISLGTIIIRKELEVNSKNFRIECIEKITSSDSKGLGRLFGRFPCYLLHDNIRWDTSDDYLDYYCRPNPESNLWVVPLIASLEIHPKIYCILVKRADGEDTYMRLGYVCLRDIALCIISYIEHDNDWKRQWEEMYSGDDTEDDVSLHELDELKKACNRDFWNTLKEIGRNEVTLV